MQTYLPPVKNTSVRQIVLDKWFPLILVGSRAAGGRSWRPPLLSLVSLLLLSLLSLLLLVVVVVVVVVIVAAVVVILL